MTDAADQPATPSRPKSPAREFLDAIAEARRACDLVIVQCRNSQRTFEAQQQYPLLTVTAQVQDLANVLARSIDALGVMSEQVIKVSTIMQRAGMFPPANKESAAPTVVAVAPPAKA